MNIRIIFLTVAVLLIGEIYSAPIHTNEDYAFKIGEVEGESTTPPIPPTTPPIPPTTAPIPPTTTPIPPTTTPVPTTTTTTTPAPEVDRVWEDLVLSGPTVVNYLSLFMVLVSNGDQALTPAPEYTVKYIHNVQSLRAVLFQISSAMQNAFLTARDDLVRIRSSMNQIPQHIKAGLLVIKSVPNDVLTTLLPYTLNNLNRAANEASTVSKPILNRFVSVGLLLEELVIVLASTTSTPENEDYFIEAKAYAADVREQWKLLEDLFEKFSERAGITETSATKNFIDEIDQVLETDGFSDKAQVESHLKKLVPIAISIDQSSYLLSMMTNTYSSISTSDMENQIAESPGYVYLGTDSLRATNQRQLWQNTISQSVKFARLAQTRHNDFVQTTPNRKLEYDTYLETSFHA